MCYPVGNENVMDKIHLMATKDKNKIYFYIKILILENYKRKNQQCVTLWVTKTSWIKYITIVTVNQNVE